MSVKLNQYECRSFLVFIVLLAVILFSLSGLFAQQKRILTLDESLRIALNESYAIKTETMNYEQNKLMLESAQRGLRTQINTNFEVPNYNKGITPIPTPTGDVYVDTRTLRTGGTLDIRQPILFTNGELFLEANYSTLRGDVEDLSWVDPITGEAFLNPVTGDPEQRKVNFPTRNWNDDVTINYVQRLFQPNQKKMTLKSTERGSQLAERRFESTQGAIYYNVLQQFYNLFKEQRRLEIEQSSTVRFETNYNNTLNKYRAGIVAEVDALQAEVEYDQAKNNLRQQETTYVQLLAEYKKYIGLPLDVEIEVQGSIQVNVFDILDEKAYLEADKNSVAIMRIEHQIIDQKDNVELKKAERSVQASLNLRYGLNETEDYSKDNWTDELFKDFSKTNGVYMRIDAPIFDWGSHKRSVEVSRIGLKQQELDLDEQKKQIRIEIRNILDKIRSGRDQMDILAKTEVNAEKSFQISEERYDIGEISIEDFFLAEDRLKNARISTLEAQINYLLAIAELNQKTLWDFERNQPLKNTIVSFLK